MSRFSSRFRSLAIASLAFLTLAATSATAQTARRRRETNANRRARIARQIQETYGHRWEAAGGGGYLRFRSGPDLRKNNEVTFFGGATYYLNPKLGILADVHGAYGNAQIGNTIFNLQNPQISQYIFSGGPSYRFYAKQKTAVSVFGTGGVAYGKFSGGSKGVPSTAIGIWPDGWRAGFTAGINFDYNFYPNLAARFTPTYIGTTFGGTVQNNLGFNLGLVYRFGKLR